MPGSESILQNVLDRIRVELDEAEVDAKYSDSYLLKNVIPASMSDVLERLNSDRKNKVACSYEFTTVQNQEYYRLPANVAQVREVFLVDSEGNPRSRIPYRGENNVWGPGYSLQGNELRLNPKPHGALTAQVIYLPTGGFQPHYATDGTLNANKDEITLSTSPSLGVLDRREGAYNGQMVRVIPSSGPIETAVIKSHTWDGTNWKITLRRPLADTAAGTISYEVVDQPSLSLVDTVVYAAVIRIAVARRVSGTVINNFRIMYNQSIKTEGDRVTSMDLKASVYDEKTRYRKVDPSYGLFGNW